MLLPDWFEDSADSTMSRQFCGTRFIGYRYNNELFTRSPFLPLTVFGVGLPAHHTFAASVLHSLKLAVDSVFVRRIAVTYMCQPQSQNLANIVFALLHRESGTPCYFISVLLPSAENSSGLSSKPTSLSAPTHDSPPRTIEECNYLLTYLLPQGGIIQTCTVIIGNNCAGSLSSLGWIEIVPVGGYD